MKVVALPDVRPRDRRVAVGTFDGVHLGHRQVIAGADAVLTFDPHPASVVSPSRAPKLLTDLPRKAELIASLGVQEMIVVPFDDAFAAKRADEFIDEVLVRLLGARQVSVGENFRFGHRAEGDVELLRAQGEFATTVHPLLEVDGEIVSSSHIRNLVAAGEVARAARLLGGPFTMRGEVVHGEKRGRELGFPTANIVPDERLACPAHGVYACAVDGATAAVSIGVRPTFETGAAELIEAHLLDFTGNLYGAEVQIAFLQRLRGERRFDSAEALIEQMRIDVQAVSEIAARLSSASQM